MAADSTVSKEVRVHCMCSSGDRLFIFIRKTFLACVRSTVYYSFSDSARASGKLIQCEKQQQNMNIHARGALLRYLSACRRRISLVIIFWTRNSSHWVR